MKKMIIVGKSGNKFVIDSFKYVGTYGIPLENLITYYNENNLLIAWDHFIHDARKDGWNNSTIKNKITTAMGEIYGEKYKNKFEKTLEKFLIIK